MNQLRVSLCQMNSVDNEDSNLKQILNLIEKASQKEHQDLICFPENSLFMRVKEGDKVAGLTLQSTSFGHLQNRAKELKTALHLGSVPLRDGDKLKNASIYIAADGSLRTSYTKIHLFDIQIEGQAPVRESDVFHRGSDPSILQLGDWHIGQTICYDIRFAELYNWYASHSCEAILVPSAFLVTTGRAHWEILLRARAIESQTYILAAAQAGTHHGVSGGQRETYGHSMIVGPWGEVVAQAQTSEPEVIQAVLDRQRIEEVRKAIPMRNHRRLVPMRR